MQPNAHAKRLWRQWERFSRAGIKLNQKNYTSGQLLAIWATVLVVLYMLLWVSRDDDNANAGGQYKSRTAFNKDTEFWQRRHLIFCVSPGRAGSQYLRNVLDTAEDIIAEHEPEPQMRGSYLQDVILRGKRSETLDERAKVKLDAIKDTLEGTPPEVAYAETNHMFVKTFSDAVLEHLGNSARITIIFLYRPAKDTIWSQLRLGWFTKEHTGRNNWYYDANDVHETERQNSHRTNSSDIVDTLIGYNADVLQRGMELEREINRRQKDGEWERVQIVEAHLADISRGDDSAIKTFLSKLQLKPDREKLKLLKRQDQNARDAKKVETSFGQSQADIEKRLDYMKNKLPLLKQVMYSS